MRKFKAIYDAALKAKTQEEFLEEIKKIKNYKRYIDQKQLDKQTKRYFTVAAKLAHKKKHKQVAWLLALGANVSDIAYAYAMQGCFDQVDDYQKRYHAASNQVIAQGYAQGRHHQQVQDYADKYPKNPLIMNAIIKGYALTGLTDKAEDYFKNYEHSLTIEDLAEAYAEGGNVDAVNSLWAKVSRGDDKFWEDHLELSLKSLATKIAVGYARSGKHEQVEIYRYHEASIKNIADTYRQIKNYSKLKEYDLSALLKSYLSDRTNVRDDKTNKTKKYKGLPLPFFQKSFKEKETAVNLLIQALDGKNVDLLPHLSTYRNGTLGEKLRAFIKADKTTSLAPYHIHSVSAFIKALQEKISSQAEPPSSKLF